MFPPLIVSLLEKYHDQLISENKPHPVDKGLDPRTVLTIAIFNIQDTSALTRDKALKAIVTKLATTAQIRLHLHSHDMQVNVIRGRTILGVINATKDVFTLANMRDAFEVATLSASLYHYPIICNDYIKCNS